MSNEASLVAVTEGTERDEERLRTLLEIVSRTRKLYVAPDVLAQFCEMAERVRVGVDHLYDAPYYMAGIAMLSGLCGVELILNRWLDPGTMLAFDPGPLVTSRIGPLAPP